MGAFTIWPAPFPGRIPIPGARAARTLSGLDYLNAMGRGEFAYPPLMHMLGMAQLAPTVEPGKVTFFLEPQEYHHNPIGSVHGGVFASLPTRPWAARFTRHGRPA